MPSDSSFRVQRPLRPARSTCWRAVTAERGNANPAGPRRVNVIRWPHRQSEEVRSSATCVREHTPWSTLQSQDRRWSMGGAMGCTLLCMRHFPSPAAIAALVLGMNLLFAAAPVDSDERASELIRILKLEVLPKESGYLGLIGESAQKVDVDGRTLRVQSQVYYML